jgi:hypothetical protein
MIHIVQDEEMNVVILVGESPADQSSTSSCRCAANSFNGLGVFVFDIGALNEVVLIERDLPCSTVVQGDIKFIDVQVEGIDRMSVNMRLKRTQQRKVRIGPSHNVLEGLANCPAIQLGSIWMRCNSLRNLSKKQQP